MKRGLLILAAIAGLTVGGVAVASVAARGGSNSVANTFVIDLAEKLYGGGGHHGRGGCGVVGMAANAVAGTLGISIQQLQTELQAGKSVGDVAQAHGMAADPFRAALTQKAKDEIDQFVAAGTINQARADALNQTLSDNWDTIVNYRLDPSQHLPSCSGFSGNDNDDDDLPSPSAASSAGSNS